MSVPAARRKCLSASYHIRNAPETQRTPVLLMQTHQIDQKFPPLSQISSLPPCFPGSLPLRHFSFMEKKVMAVRFDFGNGTMRHNAIKYYSLQITRMVVSE